MLVYFRGGKIVRLAYLFEMSKSVQIPEASVWRQVVRLAH
jgi:hypothetical protein